MVKCKAEGVNSPRVSIILRTKDRPFFLTRALQDIAKQKFRDFSLVIINDGGSAEQVDKIVELQEQNLPSRPEVFSNNTSVGRGRAWQQGFEATNSPFFVVHDDDDTWDEEFLSKTVSYLENNPDSTAVATRLEVIVETFENGEPLEQSRWIYHPEQSVISVTNLLRANTTVPIATLYRRSAVNNLSDPEVTLDVVEDWCLNLKLACAGSFGFIDGKPLAFWHQRPTDGSSETGNSVFLLDESHQQNDAKVRDSALREYIAQHGTGLPLLIGKGTEELATRLDRANQILASLQVEQRNIQEEQRNIQEELNIIRGSLQKVESLLQNPVIVRILRSVKSRIRNSFFYGKANNKEKF
ncbi:MAG: glycosyltransferase family 2 protein [Varibaculum cambriense]|uniref:glycosyltransferase family 2 protein n=1 Tax=Varibaculum cambriense TaxID=184870 RepID=UPI0029143C0E|nr:glycosyltransferase family 2 protein [Varibaculum cambriense]MDU6681827.1 glycosyltransferase family 2 protein [Varibaculum cambriense]